MNRPHDVNPRFLGPIKHKVGLKARNPRGRRPWGKFLPEKFLGAPINGAKAKLPVRGGRLRKTVRSAGVKSSSNICGVIFVILEWACVFAGADALEVDWFCALPPAGTSQGFHPTVPGHCRRGFPSPGAIFPPNLECKAAAAAGFNRFHEAQGRADHFAPRLIPPTPDLFFHEFVIMFCQRNVSRRKVRSNVMG